MYCMVPASWELSGVFARECQTHTRSWLHTQQEVHCKEHKSFEGALFVYFMGVHR